MVRPITETCSIPIDSSRLTSLPSGTGCFMLFNTAQDIVKSTHGLLTTVRSVSVSLLASAFTHRDLLFRLHTKRVRKRQSISRSRAPSRSAEARSSGASFELALRLNLHVITSSDSLFTWIQGYGTTSG